ncbi:MAG: tryptophan synthase subunit alpha [Burkholderiales bacterium]
MSRIESAFARLQSERKKALIPFITAGDPQPSLTVPLMHSLVSAGADIIELGVPFSDPMADGPTIQRASERALAKGVSLKNVVELVAAFRKDDRKTPIVLMGYANPIEAMGIEVFAQSARKNGVDGVLVVDIPPEESHELSMCLDDHEIASIFLLAPTSTDARIAEVAKLARGYVYYVSLKGVTGAAHLDLSEVEEKLPRIRKHVKLPIGVGFGIRDEQSARAIGRIADAVVIGSRIVEEIQSSPPEKVLQNVSNFVSRIRSALDQDSELR